VDFSFWNRKRVFITGHTGFKGSWLCLWLKSLGAEVTGYALDPDTQPSLFSIAEVADGMNSVIGDIRDRNQLTAALLEARPEIVIHLAAQSLVRYSYQHPVETYEVNVLGTVNLMEAVRNCDTVKSLLVITSDKCYENREREAGYHEDEAMGGYDPYSSSKGCAELVVAAYRQSFFSGDKQVAVATARAGNVIGGGDWARDRLIPDLVRSFSAGNVVTIRNPDAVRPWQHVFEALHGYLLLLEKMGSDSIEFSQAWNFGPADEDAREVAWIVEKFVSSWGEANWQVESDVENLHEAHYLRLNCSKARQDLSWKPVVELELALNWIANWYRSYYEGDDMVGFSHRQIEEFQGMIKL
jgi:CDP-glucose 4,6-dehydratase